jgi:hypothetical protein
MELSVLRSFKTLELRFVTGGTSLCTDIIVIGGGSFSENISSAIRAFGHGSER